MFFFVALASLLGLAAILGWLINPLLAAAAIGATPVALLAIHQRFVNVPLLELVYDEGENDVHYPELKFYEHQDTPVRNVGVVPVPVGFRVVKFVRLVVQNNGAAVATNCLGWVRIARETSQRPQLSGVKCPAPSAEKKRLNWAEAPHQTHLTAVRSVYASGGQEILNIAFACTEHGGPEKGRFESPFGNGASETWGKLVAFLATPESPTPRLSPFEPRAQDGLCQTLQRPSTGDYILEVTVHSENGATTKGRFRLAIGPNWNDLKLSPVS